MNDMNKMAKAYEALESAEAALALAKKMLSEATGLEGKGAVDPIKYAEKAATVTHTPASAGRIIEGVFDGQNMIDKKSNTYPVPANYASKSKLIPGDVLKLTITDEGKFLYKQIGPVERKTVVGPLVHKEGQYMVLANSKAYKVLLASVTYFRASVGDEVTLVIPANEESEWGAIEAVLPKFEDSAALGPSENKPEKKRKKKDELSLDELDI